MDQPESKDMRAAPHVMPTNFRWSKQVSGPSLGATGQRSSPHLSSGKDCKVIGQTTTLLRGGTEELGTHPSPNS